MLPLCLMLSMTHYAQNYTGIIGGSLASNLLDFSLIFQIVKPVMLLVNASLTLVMCKCFSMLASLR